jgi:co-chaperonin GroES (HSP10)
MPFMLMEHENDPRQVIYKKIGMKKLGELPGFKLLRNDVLLGVYERPEKTKSGIHLPDSTRNEDSMQGKAALVLALGPTAFVSDEHVTFHPEQKVGVGDWVSIWVSDGRKIVINGQLCRIIRDQDVVLSIPSPDSVW